MLKNILPLNSILSKFSELDVYASKLARVYTARVYMEEPSDLGGYFGNLPELREGSGQLFLEPKGHRILNQNKYLVDNINIKSTCDKSRLHSADP